MTAALAHLGLGAGAKEEDTDVLGGFQTLDSNIYKVKLGLCPLGKSKNGATSVTVSYTHDGREHSEVIYVTNRAGSTTYTRNGTTNPLPGWSQINALCHIATGKGLGDQIIEKRTIKQRNRDTGKDENVEVDVLIDLMDKQVVLAILRVHENKSVLQGTKYVPTNDKRTFNTISTQANPEGITYNELKKGVTKPVFIKKWLEVNKGKDMDKYKPLAGGAVSPSGGASSSPTSPAIDFED